MRKLRWRRLQARAVFTTPQSHLYDVVGQLVAAEVDALPVVDEGVYKGCVNAASVVHFLAEQSHWATRGVW